MAKTRISIGMTHRRTAGLSLIELLVGVAIATIAILVMMQTTLFVEQQKRTATGAADAQSGGQIGMMMITRDLRQAGYGLTQSNCASVRSYSTATTAVVTSMPLSAPVQIEPVTGGSNAINISFSTSPYGAFKAELQQTMGNSDADMWVNRGTGMAAGDVLLINQGTNCSLLQLSAAPTASTKLNNDGVGVQWQYLHARTAGSTTFAYNPPTGTSVFPAGGYTGRSTSSPNPGAYVFNLGKLVSRRYYVSGNKLMVSDNGSTASTPQELADGVVGMRAYYVVDSGSDKYVTAGESGVYVDPTATLPDPTKLLAIRVAIVMRSQVEIGAEDIRNGYQPNAASSITLWSGGPSFTLPETSTGANNGKNFRYRVYTTTIPLKNVAWNNK